MMKRKKRKEITPCENEVIIWDDETKKKMLFSVGFTHAKKALEWQHLADPVNAAGSEG